MKTRHSLKYGIILFLFVFGLTGCAGLSSKAASPDYIAGKKYAETYAKQDAINTICGHYSNRNQSLYSKRTLNGHLQKLTGRYSQDFIDGFSYGYKSNYNEYSRLYCGF